MHAIGIGLGDPAYMTQRGAALLAQAGFVAGFGVVLRVAEPLLALAAEQPLTVWEYLTRAEQSGEGRLGDCPDGFSDMSIMLIRSTVPIASAV